MTTGFIAWEGPSPITGAPVVLVLTPASDNVKTGPMWQSWLLVRDVPPFEAIRTGADRAICGDCVHRGIKKLPDQQPFGAKRTCYVSMFKGPVSIHRGVQAHRYPRLSLADASKRLAGEHVRVTAYGDPALLPFEFWDELLAEAAGWVGYTHQWRTCDPQFRSMLMASVETPGDAEQAQARGWRTFRARAVGSPLLRGEFQCPASEEAGHRATCLRCQLCRGTSSPAKSVSIQLHGQRAANKGGPRRKYDALRRELDLHGYSVLAVDHPQQTTVALALKCFYRRQREHVDVSMKRLRRGLYLVWRREVGA